MGTDTPVAIDAAVRHFCAGIADAEPFFVTVRPGEGAEVAYCFDNVTAQVAAHGGRIAWGWLIWHWPGRYLEAEHHAVWLNPAGEHIDVTPMLYGQERILFLPDPDAVFDPEHPRSNILAAEPGNAVAERYVALAKARSAIIDGYGDPGIELNLLSDEDQARLAAMEDEWMALYREMEGAAA